MIVGDTMKETKKELIDKIHDLENELNYYKDFDSLTGLYNKEAFYKLVSLHLNESSHIQYHIICIDIQQFKLINDIYNVKIGNEVLIYIANKLQNLYQQKDYFCARFSADTFFVFLPESLSNESFINQVTEIFRSIPIDRSIQPAIGIYPIHNIISVNLMCDRAFMAVESVKGMYQRNYAWYEENMRDHLIEEQELLNEADKAMKNGDFIVYIQPKCNMNNGRIMGGEALVRWNHPKNGIISPFHFIPLFERNGFIKYLDQFVWETVAKMLSQRLKAGMNIVPISVNVSRIDLFVMDVPGFFQDLCQKYNIDTQWIEIEITESAYIYEENEVIKIINQLMKLGFKVLMDDFGSGYSSLNLLKDINIDTIKLDMRFLDKQDHKSENILESVVHMAKWLNLQVIAEGVENIEQVKTLLKIGCIYAQGFYYYKPIPMTEFEVLLEDVGKIDLNVGAENAYFDMFTFKDILHEDNVSEELLNNILGAVALYARNQGQVIVLKANEAYCELTHNDDLANKRVDVLEYLVEKDRDVLNKALDESKIHRNRGTKVIVRRRINNGEIIWVQWRLFYLTERNNEEIFYASLIDVSDQMSVLEALKVSEQRFLAIMEASHDSIFEVDLKTHIVSSRSSHKAISGYQESQLKAPEDIIGKGRILPEYIHDIIAMYDAIYNGAPQANCTVQEKSDDGHIIWNYVTLIAIKNEDGESIKAVGFIRNVTKELEFIKNH